MRLSFLLLCCWTVVSAENGTERATLRGRDTKEKTKEEDRELFGGADLFFGNPWYHEVFSEEAALDAGFSADVAERIAWHADYTDSYCYNPFYWFQTADISRFKAARSLYPDLAKVHYDDCNTNQQVITAYYRYMNGCLIGLQWAAELYNNPSLYPDIDAVNFAQNILGITFHAIQDFYSHSNWIDEPDRRDKIFLDIPLCELESTFLYTGSFEEEFGIKPHGKFSVICSVTQWSDFFETSMDIYCAFSSSEICMEYADCDNIIASNGAIVADGGKVFGVDIPDGALFVNPPGINLDNRWQANVRRVAKKIGVQIRGIDDELTGDEAFDIAKALAIRASTSWLETAESIVSGEWGHSSFWNEVKTTVPSAPQEDPFEKFNQFPIQFISAGPYPMEVDDGFYLRVTLETSTDKDSSTDADILLQADGEEFTLDYMPASTLAGAAIAYNDFESGDETVYTVGPFTEFPSKIKLKNDAPDAGDVLTAIGNSILSAFVSLGEAIRGAFLNNADYVGTGGFVMEPSWLNDISVGTEKGGRVNINGGDSEGAYDIYFEVKKISQNDAEVESTYEVRISSIVSRDESNEASSADEPFLMTALTSFPGGKQFHMTNPYDDVDEGDRRFVRKTFSQVTLNQNHGAMVLKFRIYESDSENGSDRNKLFNKFKGEEPEEEKSFLVTIGEAIAADWKLRSIRVYGFRRGDSLKAGQVLYDSPNSWIEGGKSKTFSLQSSGMQSLSGINFDPVAACQPVYKETGPQCNAPAQASEFDGGSTDYECAALSFAASVASPYPLGLTPITLTVSDPARNGDTCETTVTVEDKTQPAISGCGPVTVVECSAFLGTPQGDSQLSAFFADVVASDACPFTLTNDALVLFPVSATTEVTFTATDSSNNVATCDGSITVQDTIAPVISGCSPVTVECSAPGGTPQADSQLSAFFADVVASDVCDADPAISNDALVLFPVSATTDVTFTATDDTSNFATCDGSVKVQDSIPPAINGCSQVVVECWALGGTPQDDYQLMDFFADVVAPDVCDADPDLSNDAPALFPVSATTDVKFTVIDDTSNVATCDGTVTVQDTTPPTVSTTVDSITLWPPNNKYFYFNLFTDYGLASEDVCCGTEQTYAITAVFSNEADKKNAPIQSIYQTDETSFAVQAQRLGSGDGRLYTVQYDVTDCQRQVTSTEVYVVVDK